jgi:DeoR family deoxyribose operon repressor
MRKSLFHNGAQMMTRKDRVDHLFEALCYRRPVRLRDAAKILGVSEMTVRRDIVASTGRLVCVGGYVFRGPLTFNATSPTSLKQTAVAETLRSAVKHLKDGETVFIDSGEPLAMLARQISDEISLTVVCHSIDVANALRQKPNVRIVLLGGHYAHNSATFFSDESIAMLRNLRIDTAFISASGFDEVRGAFCNHFLDAAVKRIAITNSFKSHLIVNPGKFGKVDPIWFARFHDFASIITDSGNVDLRHAR